MNKGQGSEGKRRLVVTKLSFYDVIDRVENRVILLFLRVDTNYISTESVPIIHSGTCY